MRTKALIPLAVLSALLFTAGCRQEATSALPEAVAPGPVQLSLMPYTSAEFGFTGIVPDGWVEGSPGHFQPRRPGVEPTLLAQLAWPGATMEDLPQELSLGQSSGRRETTHLDWDLYSFELRLGVDMSLAMDSALAEADAGVYGVFLVTSPEDQEALRQDVFLPALDALRPFPADHAAGPGLEPTPLEPLGGPEQPADARVRPTDGMEMVYAHAGEFPMGNDAIWWWLGSLQDGSIDLQVLSDQRPQHTVHLDAFWIDRTEVTVAMFRAFVEATGYSTAAEREGWGYAYRAGPREEEYPKVSGADWQHPRGPGFAAQDDHPVTQVSWDDAAAYCAWAGAALPSEAQWEKACRGVDGQVYPWGDEFDPRRLNYCDASCPVERWADLGCNDGFPYTSPAGSFPEGASPYGACDMSGNVYEWTADRFDEDYYANSPYDNPTGSDTGEKRVQHGGAWYNKGRAGWLTCSLRHATVPWNRADDLGFRCAMPAE